MYQLVPSSDQSPGELHSFNCVCVISGQSFFLSNLIQPPDPMKYLTYNMARVI